MRTVADIETDLLLEAIREKYGFDYREYQRTSLQRRLRNFALETGLRGIGELIPIVLRDRKVFMEVFHSLSLSVTEMFRDPEMFEEIRTGIIPFLKTFPYINIWNVGCATGEEAYSMAIMLKEENLLHRSQIYATDLNEDALRKGVKGIFPMEEMQRYTRNYQLSGGRYSFADYYISRYKQARMNNELREKITFSRHNLVTDSVFTENQFIMCKNVLIYFNQTLQLKVLKLLTKSLCFNGFLCLGDDQALMFTEMSEYYKIVDRKYGIYQKKLP